MMAGKFPVKTAYALAKLGIKLNEPLAVIDQVRKGLIDKYVPKDERGRQKTKQGDGGMVFDMPPEAEAKLNEEFSELLDQSVEVVFEKVKLPEGSDGKVIEVEPVILMALMKFVEV